MITYFDTSTLLKLLIEEAGSDRAALLWDTAEVAVSAAIVFVEARAALAAATRGGRLTPSQHERAKTDLHTVVDCLAIVEISVDLIRRAADLAELEALRGYDAVHLAAALTVQASVLTSADTDLCAAAQHQGIHVANPLDSPGLP